MTEEKFKELVKLIVVETIVSNLTETMSTAKDARKRANTLWDNHKQGILASPDMRSKMNTHERDAIAALLALEKGGYEIVKKTGD